MQNNISISKPCPKNWENMTPNENGRYCGACKKTVIDFSQMTKEEIEKYFFQRKAEGICGYFEATQVDIHQGKFHQLLTQKYRQVKEKSKFTFGNKITLASITVLMFFVGCSRKTTTPMGEVSKDNKDKTECGTKQSGGNGTKRMGKIIARP